MAARRDSDVDMPASTSSSSSSSNRTPDSKQGDRGRETKTTAPPAPRKRGRSPSPTPEARKKAKTGSGDSQDDPFDLTDILEPEDALGGAANSLVSLSDSKSENKTRISGGAEAPGGARVGLLLGMTPEGKKLLDGLYYQFHMSMPFCCGQTGDLCTHFRRWNDCPCCNWGYSTCLASHEVALDIIDMESAGGVCLPPPCFECASELLKALQHFFEAQWTYDDGQIVLQTVWPLLRIVWSFIDFTEPRWQSDSILGLLGDCKPSK